METESTNTGAPESGLVKQLHVALESARASAARHRADALRLAADAQRASEREARDEQTAAMIERMIAAYDESAPSSGTTSAAGVAGVAMGLVEVSADGMPPADSRDGVFRVLTKADGPLSTSEIVEQALALGVKARDATIRSTISKMARDKQITKVRHGVYQLAAGTAWLVSHEPDGSTRAGFTRPSANRPVGRIWELADLVPDVGPSDADDEPDEDEMSSTDEDRETAANDLVQDDELLAASIAHYTTARPIENLAAQTDQEEEDYDEEYFEPSDEDYDSVDENWELAAL